MTLPSQVSPPQIALSDVAVTGVAGADVAAVPFFAEDGELVLGPGADALVGALDVDLFADLERAGATGRAGEVVTRALHGRAGAASTLGQVMLVGVGGGLPEDLRRAGAGLARAARGSGTVVTTLGSLCDDPALSALVEGLVLGSFEFHWRSGGPRHQVAERVVLAGLHDAFDRRPVLDRALAVAGAGWTARTLALVPSNLKTPAWLAEQARSAARRTGLDVRVWDEHDLERDGFGGLLGVGQGSASPPRLVRLDYEPRGATSQTPRLVLVGKGITFDSGGLSLKSRDTMMSMKRDMSGAAVVLAVLGALAAIQCSVRVTGLLACAENSVGGAAIRPGDVVHHYGGRTSEVTNTDAEGRLVLGDAMAYAVSELEPDVLVDVATLTGAIKMALGQRTGGFYANRDLLAQRIRSSSLAAGEPMWRMPLVDDYEERIASKVADADNAGGPPGSITAALFLRHFAGRLPWAHLDLSSVGDSPDDAFEYTKGATGFGARALLHWLGSPDPLAGL